MDYTNVPTTVFTPIEYGACGYSEEDAIEKFGRPNISVFHTKYKPLEWMYTKEVKGSVGRTCYVKIIVNKAD